MLEIFDSIGMGRSLLILGAPGSGKTTMLLELARQLIARAREDVTQPIPMVFNLASWTEKLTLANWLAQELNNLYSVPRKTSPDWVKGNKLLLLLDGLDEVRQESRTKCVAAINAFRKEHGLTSLAVCSRSQDYADLNAKLSFEGAIEVQPLTQKQITEFFNRFGKEMTGIKQVLKKDSALREMAETPLFLSIMIMAYRDKQDVDILVSQDKNAQRKHLFDTYIESMFERSRSTNATFKKEDVLHWLLWLSNKILKHELAPFLLENMQPVWLQTRLGCFYSIITGLVGWVIFGLSVGIVTWLSVGHKAGLILGLVSGAIGGLNSSILTKLSQLSDELIFKRIGKDSKLGFSSPITWSNVQKILVSKLYTGLTTGILIGVMFGLSRALYFDEHIKFFEGLVYWLIVGAIIGVSLSFVISPFEGIDKYAIVFGVWGVQIYTISYVIISIFSLVSNEINISVGDLVKEFSFNTGWFYILICRLIVGLAYGLIYGLGLGVFNGLFSGIIEVVKIQQANRITQPGQRLVFTRNIFLLLFLFLVSVFSLFGVLFGSLFGWVSGWLIVFCYLVILGEIYAEDGLSVIPHYVLRVTLARNNLLPWRLVPFLDHCVDLIFLRRVGGGYIFVHRLLMEHFAERLNHD
jgi:hypothetical protein